MNEGHLRPVLTREAQRHARAIADALDSKVVSNQRYVLGDALCPYKVPFHSDEFWFTIFVSDLTYEFRGNHKRGCAVPARFCVTLKEPWETMLTTTPVPLLSRPLGVEVFSSDDFISTLPTATLLGEPSLILLRQIDFAPVRRVFLNAAQIQVWSELVSPSQCASQVRVYRDLLHHIHRESSNSRSA